MKNLLILATTLSILLVSSCGSQQKKVVCPEQLPVSSQAMCTEIVVTLCSKGQECNPDLDERFALMCESQSINMCAGFNMLDESERTALYDVCLPALESLTCEQLELGQFPEECLALVTDDVDAGTGE